MVQATAAAVAEHRSLAQTVAQWQAVLASVDRAASARQLQTLSMADRLFDAGERAIARLRNLNCARMSHRRAAKGDIS